ncbi:unnamed protein product [Blepharisma stoltei]|uniref:Uncharacterized protein n=1 Tax=Blepharisma stoltei TaxID=1481888 RepID=A0AAU9JQ33_9CILI|nr:unnamed protein product [Blepharisma stoltei]
MTSIRENLKNYRFQSPARILLTDDFLSKTLDSEKNTVRTDSTSKQIPTKSRLSATSRSYMSATPHSTTKQINLDDCFSPGNQFFPKFLARLQGLGTVKFERTVVKEEDKILSFNRILQSVNLSPVVKKSVKKRKRVSYMPIGTHYKKLEAKITLNTMEFNNSQKNSPPSPSQGKRYGLKIVSSPYPNNSPFKGEAIGRNIQEIKPIKMIDIATWAPDCPNSLRASSKKIKQ